MSSDRATIVAAFIGAIAVIIAAFIGAREEIVIALIEKDGSGKTKLPSPPVTLRPQKDFSPTEKNIIAGEAFAACGISDLVLTPSNVDHSIASLGRKHGALFNQTGEMIQDPLMKLGEPFNISSNCVLTVVETPDIQGHISYKISYGPRD